MAQSITAGPFLFSLPLNESAQWEAVSYQRSAIRRKIQKEILVCMKMMQIFQYSTKADS
jgi:hypothetical protein